MTSVSELRQDIVSGDWVVVATGRAKRPDDFLKERRSESTRSRRMCPFERRAEKSLLMFMHGGAKKGRDESDWWVEVVSNKYPALGSGMHASRRQAGPYHWMEGIGFHEVVVTRDHERSFGLMDDAEAELVVRAYQERFLALREKPNVKYISIFHNHGRHAGATIAHPHSQIITLPVIPPDFGRSLTGSAAYQHEHKSCVYCTLIAYELKVKERLVWENKHFIVFAPFASKSAFELRLVPRRHSARFEDISAEERYAFGAALRVALAKLYHGLGNPDYNFFFHTAPTQDSEPELGHYHWHVEILPKTAIWAGFEIGTGIEISTIAPETAAAFLRNIE